MSNIHNHAPKTNIQKAIEEISGKKTDETGIALLKVIDAACAAYNLSPADSEFVRRKCMKK